MRLVGNRDIAIDDSLFRRSFSGDLLPQICPVTGVAVDSWTGCGECHATGGALEIGKHRREHQGLARLVRGIALCTGYHLLNHDSGYAVTRVQRKSSEGNTTESVVTLTVFLDLIHAILGIVISEIPMTN